MVNGRDFIIRNGVLERYTGCEQEITVPDGVKEIGEHAFSRCGSAVRVFLPDSVKIIGTRAFEECRSLTEVVLPESLVTIRAGAFSNCDHLAHLHIPASAIQITFSAFTGCVRLTDFTLDPANPRFRLENGIVLSKRGTVAEYCPPSTVGDVVIPEGVKKIQPRAFQTCTEIASLTMPDSVTDVSSRAFLGCVSLRRIRFSNALTTLKRSLCEDCKNLTEVVLPEHLTTIEEAALADTNLTDLTLPASVIFVGKRALDCRRGLRHLTVLGDPTVLDYWSGIDPDLLSMRADHADFSTLTAMYQKMILRDFTARLRAGEPIPEKTRTCLVEYVRKHAKACWNADPDFRPLILEERLITARDYAWFVEHTSPEREPEITAWLLDYRNRCLDPEELVRVDRNRTTRMIREATRLNPTPAELRRVFRGEVQEDGSWQITDYRGDAPDVVIPEKIGKNPVSSIGYQAFSASRDLKLRQKVRDGRMAIETVTVPEGITSIQGRAFAGCRNLRSISLPASLTTLGNGAFEGCSSLSALTLPAGVPSFWPSDLEKIRKFKRLVVSSPRTRLVGDWSRVHRFVICAPEGSYAHKWALELGFPWEPLPAGEGDGSDSGETGS